MQVFNLRQRLIHDYSDYVTSFIHVREPRLAAFVHEQLRSGVLWPEPLIQLNPSFEEGGSVDQLVADKTLLSYTEWGLQPFARDCGNDGPPFRWNEERRVVLRAERDAAFFHLYGIGRDDADYIMDSFLIVKQKDIQRDGDYRTKLVILDIYDRMQRAIETGEPYQTLLDPPPADPRVAHPAHEAGDSRVVSAGHANPPRDHVRNQ